MSGMNTTTLLRVELRKATDTRSGRWLLAMIVGLSIVALGWSLAHADDGVSFTAYGGGMVGVVAFLAPVIGLLAMTAEWTQRTALTTFTLAPRRGRVLAAKFTAAMVLAMATLAIGIALSLLTTAIGGAVHGGATWAGTGDEIRAYVIIVAAQVVMASAFGALAAQTTVAMARSSPPRRCGRRCPSHCSARRHRGSTCSPPTASCRRTAHSTTSPRRSPPSRCGSSSRRRSASPARCAERSSDRHGPEPVVPSPIPP